MTQTSVLIAGCGPGSREYVTRQVEESVKKADVLVGSKRCLDLFPESLADVVELLNFNRDSIHSVAERYSNHNIVWLVSGDPCLYSFTRLIVSYFGEDNCTVLPGIGALQVACSRLKLSYDNIRTFSVHGRDFIDIDCDCDKIAIFADERIDKIKHVLLKYFAAYDVFLCEDLTLPNEQIRLLTDISMLDIKCSSLSLFLLIKRNSG